jgi:hypothetical protein
MQVIKQMFRSEYAGEHITTTSSWQNSDWVHTNEFIPNRVTNRQISNRAVIIGNGESRAKYEVNLLKNHRGGLLGAGAVQTYGCNALYRDFTPTFLVTTGKEITQEIAASGYCDDHIVYANSEHVATHPGKFYLVPQDPHYSAGAIATYLAAFDGHKTIYFLGFDTGAGADYNNNVYAGTNGYGARNQNYTEDHMVKCLEIVMGVYPDIDFVRVMPTQTWRCPPNWQRMSNFRQITTKDFHIEIDL